MDLGPQHHLTHLPHVDSLLEAKSAGDKRVFGAEPQTTLAVARGAREAANTPSVLRLAELLARKFDPALDRRSVYVVLLRPVTDPLLRHRAAERRWRYGRAAGAAGPRRDGAVPALGSGGGSGGAELPTEGGGTLAQGARAVKTRRSAVSFAAPSALELAVGEQRFGGGDGGEAWATVYLLL